MPKTKPATRGDLALVVAVLFLLLLIMERVDTYSPHGTIKTIRRIEQKVNQSCR